MGKPKSGTDGKWGRYNVTCGRKAGGSDVNNRSLGNAEVGSSFLTVVTQSVWGWLKE